DRFPIWMPDGKAFVFVSDRNGMTALYRQSVDGAGEAERLTDGTPTQQTPNALTPDGRNLILDYRGDLFLLPLDGSRRMTALWTSPAFESRAALSADGRLLAYQSNESGK